MHVLTHLQFEIARLYASGVMGRDIASRVGTTYGSVKCMLPRIRKKLGARTRREIAAALQNCEARGRSGNNRLGRSGIRPGDPITFVSGPYRGRDGVYIRSNNSVSWYVQIGSAQIATAAQHIRPKEQA